MDASALLPHRPPWLRIDRVLALTERTAVAEKRLTAGDPLVGEEGLGELLVLELLAQTAACLMGGRSGGRAGHLGYLVAARGWKFPRRAAPGETLTLTVTLEAQLGALARFSAAARAGDEEVASGELTCAVRFEEPAEG